MAHSGKMNGTSLGARAELALSSRDALIFGSEIDEPASAVAADSANRICGAAGCPSGWLKPWRNRRRPIFEERWSCSGRCLETLVRAAVRREAGGGAASGEDAHGHRVPLGLVLLAQGWITHPQLQAALEAQKKNGKGRIGDWLVQSCGLAEERVTRGLGVQWSCPVLQSEGFSATQMACVMPKQLVAEFGLVPLRVAGEQLLYLAFEDQKKAAAALAIEQMSGLRVESGLLSGTQFAQVRDSILSAEAVSVQNVRVADLETLSKAIVRTLGQRQSVASRLVRIQDYYWMRIWLEKSSITGPGSLPQTAKGVKDYLFTVGGTGMGQARSGTGTSDS